MPYAAQRATSLVYRTCPSLRFLSRKVYLAAVVVLVSALATLAPRAAEAEAFVVTLPKTGRDPARLAGDSSPEPGSWLLNPRRTAVTAGKIRPRRTVPRTSPIPLPVERESTMSNKPGRNDPYPCDSGQKYKRCCLAKDQLAESAALAAAATRAAEAAHHHHSHEGCDFCGAHPIDDEDELTRDSNAVVDLVREGKLDQPEAAARDLLERYPQVHDGYDRLGMVYEARGQKKEAADCYCKVIEFVRAHPDQYEPTSRSPSSRSSTSSIRRR